MYMRLKRKIFSKDREANDKSAKISLLTGLGAAGVGYKGGEELVDSVVKKIVNPVSTEEEASIVSTLADDAANKGIAVYKSKNPDNTFYSPAEKLVVVGGDARHPEFLAHELGHAHYDSKEGGAVGRAAHKAYMLTKGANGMRKGGMAAAIIGGGLSGYDTVKSREKGKKENKIARHSTWVAPLIVATPGLVAEGLASRKGIKMLKDAGASKEIIKNARKGLTEAWGTYAAIPAINAGIGEATRAATIGLMEYGRGKHDNKKD